MCICLFVDAYLRTTGNEAVDDGFLVQRGLKNNVAILLKRRGRGLKLVKKHVRDRPRRFSKIATLGHIRKIACLSSPPVRIFLPVLPFFILYAHVQPPGKGHLRRQPCQLLNWCKARGTRRRYIVGLCFRGLQLRGFGWWECDPGRIPDSRSRSKDWKNQLFLKIKK